MSNKILQKIFSVTKYDNHKIYTILGTRLKFKRKKRHKKFQQLQEQIKLLQNQIKATNNLLTQSINPHDIPKASGYMRIIQKLCFDGLCEIDRICRKHNLKYWLDFGTLLGAVRHDGFIPWDDDLDICMMAEDYEKFCQIAKEELKESSYEFHVFPSQIGKLLHKDFTPNSEEEWIQFIFWLLKGKLCFAVDIFPWYPADEKLDTESLHKQIKDACVIKEQLLNRNSKRTDFEKADTLTKEVNQKLSGNGEKCFMGLECTLRQPRIREINDIFPLQEMNFEGKSFFVPNKLYKLLTHTFNNFNAIRIDHSHLCIHQLPFKDKEKLLECIKPNDSFFQL